MTVPARCTPALGWFMSQNWNIRDKYKNTSRDGMPGNETITSYADRIYAFLSPLSTSVV